MGKKTNKFISAVQEQQKACKDAMVIYISTVEEMAKMEPLADKYVDFLIHRFDELVKEHKGDRVAAQKAMCVDPKYLAVEAESDKMGLALTERKRICSGARTRMGNALVFMKDRLAEFEKYLDKKSKSKNPFKSKKSIPAARDFITASKTFRENSLKYLSDIGGTDF